LEHDLVRKPVSTFRDHARDSFVIEACLECHAGVRRADHRRHAESSANEEDDMATAHQGGVHHESAAEHHEEAAKHHREAAKHHEDGEHERAAHHAHLAHAHSRHAADHGHEAAKHYAEHHADEHEDEEEEEEAA
jgi:hypothetical protein